MIQEKIPNIILKKVLEKHKDPHSNTKITNPLSQTMIKIQVRWWINHTDLKTIHIAVNTEDEKVLRFLLGHNKMTFLSYPRTKITAKYKLRLARTSTRAISVFQ